MEFNQAQLEAIQTLNRNVTLVAGAGTGKTAVLTERFIALLKNGNLPEGRELSGIAAITFTDKAADEMKSRILRRLAENSEELPNLEGQMDFRISTIHGFCAKILRDDPASAGVDPEFSILDEAEANALMMESLRESYEEIYSEAHDPFILEHEWYVHNHFLQDVLALDRQLRAANASLEQVKKATVTFSETKDTSDHHLRTEIKETLGCLRKDNALFKFFQKDNRLALLDGTTEERNHLYRTLREEGDCRGKGTDRVLALLMDYCAARESHYIPAYTFLFDLLALGRATYQEKKRRHGALDYDDLQEKVLGLLKNPVFREKIQAQIQYLMVDEGQDINDLQAEIFYAICSDKKPLDRNNLFIVGDPRQSIYGFRHARAELFHQLQKDILGSGGIRISMQTNYRCSPQIIEYVNGVFRDRFSHLEELEAGSQSPNAGIFWCTPEEGEAFGVLSDARRVKDQIRQLHLEGIGWDEIGLLFRASTHMHIYEEQLKEEGIPCVNVSSRSFWKRQEVMDLLAAALVATEQADDIWWITYLRSPLAGLSDRKLLQYRGAGKNWEERLMANKYSDTQTESILQDVRRMREVLRRENLPVWLRHIRKVYDVFCAGEPDAERKLANLDLLHDWLEERWSARNPSPEALTIQWLHRMESEMEEAAQGDTEEGRVELMTIHKAKGLEKRVIFLIGIDGAPNVSTDTFLFEADQVHLRGSARYHNARIKRKAKEEEEEIRILYVALTRAKESLYLTAQTGKSQGYEKMLRDAGRDPEHLLRVEKFPKSLHPGSRNKINVQVSRLPVPSISLQNSALSASQFMLFRQCRRYWYLRYILKFPEERFAFFEEAEVSRDEEEYRLTGIQRGSAFHRMVELDAGESVEALVHRVLEEENIQASVLEMQQFIQWIRSIRNYGFRGKLQHELTFDWNRKGVLWTGSIDLVEEGTPPKIYDFKTNQSDESLLEAYAFQMQFYALAFQTLHGVIPRSYLWWMPKNRMIPVDVSPKALRQVEQEMDEFAHYAVGGYRLQDFPCTEVCIKRCPMQGFCSASKARSEQA